MMGVSILQYVNATIIFIEHDMSNAVDMKIVLCRFEKLSSLKINFHKSGLFSFERAKEDESHYKQLFGCEVVKSPFTYLGIPIHYHKLTNNEWKCIEDKFEKKLNCIEDKFENKLNFSKGKLMSYGGQLVLVN